MEIDEVNRNLLEFAISDLDEKGFIEYTGEYGAEITTFVPFVFWLKKTGRLEGRNILTYDGMRPYYYFLSDAQYSEKQTARSWRAMPLRKWPSPSTYTAVRSPWHLYPDYRSIYKDGGPAFDRPVVYIQNKFNVEWGIGPINYLPLVTLKKVFGTISEDFIIVYSRPNIGKKLDGYTADHNKDCNYPDREILDQNPHVIVLEDYCVENDLPYNLTKLQILAKSYLMVGVQGGGSHLLACFGASLFILLHIHGPEDPHAYSTGPYKYLASPPPTLLVTRSFAEINRAIDVFSFVGVQGRQLVVDKKAGGIIKAFGV